MLSPGEALAERAAWEAAAARAGEREWAVFTAAVRERAASGRLDVGDVLAAWAVLAAAVVGVLAARSGEPAAPPVAVADPGVSPWPESPDLTAAYARLMSDDTPGRVWATAGAVLAVGAGLAWGAARVRRELRDALSPTGGPAVAGATGVVGTGGSWASVPAMLARDVTGGVFNAAVLRDAAGASRKRWVTRRDERVRPSHAAADGQTVPMGGVFVVGGWGLAFPGDPAAPVWETARCRCVLVPLP